MYYLLSFNGYGWITIEQCFQPSSLFLERVVLLVNKFAEDIIILIVRFPCVTSSWEIDVQVFEPVILGAHWDEPILVLAVIVWFHSQFDSLDFVRVVDLLQKLVEGTTKSNDLQCDRWPEQIGQMLCELLHSFPPVTPAVSVLPDIVHVHPRSMLHHDVTAHLSQRVTEAKQH